MPTQLLVDGHSILFRAFHALPPELARKDGVPTGALYGFVTMLLKVLADEKPDRVVVVFDAPHPTFRHQSDATYKATRSETPPELKMQQPLVEELLAVMEIPSLAIPGVEADDTLGTLARIGTEKGYRTAIVSGDRDLLQLVDGSVTVLLTSRLGMTQLERMDPASVEKKMGVPPRLVPDLKGLMGDASDNIRGVAGIGQKSAVSLVQTYGPVEAIYAQLDNMENTRWKKALAGKVEDALHSKRMATIISDVEVQWPQAQEPYRLPKTPELRQFLERMELFSLVRRLYPEEAGASADASPAVRTVPEPVRVEPSAVDWSRVQYAVIVADGASLPYHLLTDRGEAVEWPEPDLPKIPLWGWDVKRLLRQGLLSGNETPRFVEDGAIGAYLLNSSLDEYGFPAVAAREGYGDALSPGQRLAAMRELLTAQSEALKQNGLFELYHDVEMRLLPVLAEMEARGIRVDKSRLEQLGVELDRNLDQLRAAIYEAAGEPFNINSPQQLGQILFERLGLPTLKKTKTGYSTDADTLETLAPLHPVVAKILEYRQLTKVKGTYIDGLIPLIDADGRVHTTFHQTVAATGRLSSSDPNLQNIPVRLPVGRRVRETFVPSPGRVFLAADYSQIELRMLAHLSGDQHLIDAFLEGEDIHRRTASEIFNIPWESVDATWRGRAKAVNFGIIYGISDFGLARDTGVSRAEAGEYIQRYFARYPGLKSYFDQILEGARQNGYVATILNRRRPLPDINHKNRARRQYAERTAVNTVIQGSAADLIKLAMIAIDRETAQKRLKSAMILQVHDELIWDAIEAEKAALSRMAHRCMTTALDLSVPLVVELKHGSTWENLKPLEVSPENA